MTREQVDQVVELDLGYVPEAAVSGPLLIQDDYRAFVTFNAMRLGTDGRRIDADTAVVELKGCWLTKFGYPNDEALPGHPLYAKGLHAYGIFEVLGSSWISSVHAQNLVPFPKPNPRSSTSSRHFIFTFHDSTLECLADDISLKIWEGPYSRILAELTRPFAQ